MKWTRAILWIGGVGFIVFGLYWLPGFVGVGLFDLKGDPRVSTDPYLEPYLDHLVQTPVGHFEPWQAVLVYGGMSIVPLVGGLVMWGWAWRIGQRKP